MNTNLLFSDALQFMGDIAPITLNNTNAATIWMDMRNVSKIGVVIQAGVMHADSDIDLLVRQATSAAGAGAKAVLAALDTEILTGADDGKQVIVNIDQVDLDFDNGFAFVEIKLTETGSQAALVSASAYGIGASYAPGTNVSTVKTIMNANPNQ